MSLQVTALNSGSNGNCYYVGNKNEAVLIDAGISCREIEKRMKRLDLELQKVKAVFISHEHSDHIRGLRVLSKKYNLPVYITIRTLLGSKLSAESPMFVKMRSFQAVRVGDLEVTPFHKFHDAADPHSFVVQCGEVKVGVFTDIGRSCENVINYFRQCHAVFLETNYDREMLENGRYPYFLKSRITNGNGHLSNDEAYELFVRHRPSYMSHLFLSHISKDNNDPSIISSLFSKNPNGTKVILTSREQEIPVYNIEALA